MAVRLEKMAVSTDSGAPSISLDIELDHEDAEGKLCGVCKVPISIHVGKPGIGKCFGGAFTKAFEVLFRTVKGLTSELQAERTEARDREQRLKAKMSEMEGQLSHCKDQLVESTETLKKVSEELARSTKRLAEIERSESFSSKSKPTQPVHIQSKRRKRAYGQGGASVETTPEKAESITATDTSLCTNTMPVQPSRQRSFSEPMSYADATCTSDTTSNGNGATQPNKKEGQKPDPLHSSPKEVGEVWQTVATRKTRQRQATIKPTTSSLGQLRGAQRISKRVFYVGGVSPECSSEDLRSFCEKHCRVIQCHVMSSSRYGTVSARLVVSAEDGTKIEAIRWPDHVFARPWRFPMSSSPTVSSPTTGEASEPKIESPAAAEPEISQ